MLTPWSRLDSTALHALGEHRFGHGTRRTRAGRNPRRGCCGLQPTHGCRRGRNTRRAERAQALRPEFANEVVKKFDA